MCLRVHVQRQKAHNSAVRLRGCVFDDRLVLPTGLKGEPLPLDASLVMKLAKGSTCPVSSFTFPSSERPLHLEAPLGLKVTRASFPDGDCPLTINPYPHQQRRRVCAVRRWLCVAVQRRWFSDEGVRRFGSVQQCSSSSSGGLVAVSRRPPTAGSAPEQRGDNGNDVWQPTTVRGTTTPAHGHSASAYRGPATARGRKKALKEQ